MYFLLEQINYYLYSFWENVNILEHIPLLCPLLIFSLTTWLSEKERRGDTSELASFLDSFLLLSVLTIALRYPQPHFFPLACGGWVGGRMVFDFIVSRTPIILDLCFPSLFLKFWNGINCAMGGPYSRCREREMSCLSIIKSIWWNYMQLNSFNYTGRYNLTYTIALLFDSTVTFHRSLQHLLHEQVTWVQNVILKCLKFSYLVTIYWSPTMFQGLREH